MRGISLDHGKFQSMLSNGKMTKFTWKFENFSSIKDKKLYSKYFYHGDRKWRILIYPKGNNVNYLSVYLEPSTSVAHGQFIRYAEIGLAVIDLFSRRFSKAQVVVASMFKAECGFSSFLPLNELHNPKRGYLVNDACLVEAYITNEKTNGLISHRVIVATHSDKYKTSEADSSNASSTQPSSHKTISVSSTQLSGQKTISVSSTQPSGGSVAIEPEETMEEDISKFFTTLESELSSSNIVFSQQEAKEALDKLDDALKMTPVNFYHSGKFSPLKQAFKILASFDCSSTILTIEQKTELLAMEESLKELADRSVRAKQDKNCLTVKETDKLSITRNLECSLTRYKEVDSDLKQVEQTLAALNELVGEAQKKRKNMLAERTEIFRSSKRMKMELKALGKEWAECEAKAKDAEEEEKTVETKWGRMKDFISSIKEDWERNEQSMGPTPRVSSRQVRVLYKRKRSKIC